MMDPRTHEHATEAPRRFEVSGVGVRPRDPFSVARCLGGRTGRRRARGTVLIVTMWVLIVLAGTVLVLAQSVRIEGACSANHAAKQEAWAVENGAIQYVVAGLDGLGGETPDEANMPCEAIPVGNGAFWIICPSFDNGREQAYGLVDEASKVNVNTASEDMLLALPGMTPEAAAAILDWRDSDSDLTLGGAESEYYLLLPDPYECKNSLLETVDELLLVKLMTSDLMLGEDLNRNGCLDDNENDADESEPPDNHDGKLDVGLLPLVTVYSAETRPSNPRPVDINRARSSELRNVLRRSVSEERLDDVVTRASLGQPFENILDFYFRTGMTIDEFEPIASRLTTRNEPVVRGLINVCTAPKEVLLCLPGLEESDVSSLVSGRAGDNVDRSTIAWVAGVLSQEKAVGIGSLITAKSYQYSADIVSVCGSGRAFRRCRIVVDGRESPPSVVYRQDLTSLGWPLSAELRDELRSGATIAEILEDTRQEVR